MNSTTQPPAIIDGDVAVSYVLVPFLLITIVGIVAAVVSGLSARMRQDTVAEKYSAYKLSYREIVKFSKNNTINLKALISQNWETYSM